MRRRVLAWSRGRSGSSARLGRCIAQGVGLLAILGLTNGCSERAPQRPPVPPNVPGLRDPALSSRDRGEVLLAELGCLACHADDAASERLDVRRGPDLRGLATRLHPGHVQAFLADPHAVEPGTTMPGLLLDLDPAERATAAAALTHYLRSLPAPADAAPTVVATAGDAEARRRGHELFHDIGCAACHAPRTDAGTEQPFADAQPLGDLRAKYPFGALQAFLLAPHTVRPAGRMPDLHLLPAEANDLATFLLAEAAPVPPAPAIEPAQVAAGRHLFAARGCVHCHELADAERPPAKVMPSLAKLDMGRGCLGTAPGAWPAYELTDAQRQDLTTALQQRTEPSSDEQRLRRHLASRHCLACHGRGEGSGPGRARSDLFRGDPNLGEEGRLPPPLDGIGAKLQPAWLEDVIAGGTSLRPYLRTRMPAFGDTFAQTLAPLLARVDVLPPLPLTPLPEDDQQRRVVHDLGRELVGDKGMNCITCHAVAGEHVGTMVALDLVDTTAQRLRPDWFQHFLREPFRFRPGTLMPQFFVGGVSARPTLGGGDTQRQIEAMWHYLAEGRNVHKPDGMRRPPIPLVVGEEAVLLRRSVQPPGKRAIGVGYPRGVNLTFDAESLALDQIWCGGFLDAAPVWTGQGSGQARLLGAQRAMPGKGPAFAELPTPTSAWPTTSRRELGQAWLGYDLDAQQRPTFRYRVADVTIDDTPRELPDVAAAAAAGEGGARALLRRTLVFTSPTDKTLHFRAAREARIDDRGEGLVLVGPALQLQLPKGRYTVRDAGDQKELLVAVPIVDGRAELVVDYRYREAPK